MSPEEFSSPTNKIGEYTTKKKTSLIPKKSSDMNRLETKMEELGIDSPDTSNESLFRLKIQPEIPQRTRSSRSSLSSSPKYKSPISSSPYSSSPIRNSFGTGTSPYKSSTITAKNNGNYYYSNTPPVYMGLSHRTSVTDNTTQNENRTKNTYSSEINILLSKNMTSRQDLLRYRMKKSSIPRGLVGLSNLGNTVSVLVKAKNLKIVTKKIVYKKTNRQVLYEFDSTMCIFNRTLNGLLCLWHV